MEITKLLFAVTAGIAGAAAGSYIPAAGERLMAYKCSRRPGKYSVAVTGAGWQWFYMTGLGIAWMASAMEASALKGLFFAIISFGMLTITYLDNRYRIIANESILAVLAAGLVYQFACGGLAAVGGGLIAMMCGILICLAASLLSRGKGAVGAGDVKLMAACCCMAGMPDFLNVLFYMAVTLGIYCIGGLKLRRLRMDSYFPMGGFIAVGLIVSFYPQQIQLLVGMIGL